MDWKTPSSMMESEMSLGNVEKLGRFDQVKFPVEDCNDLDYVLDLVEKNFSIFCRDEGPKLLVSPIIPTGGLRETGFWQQVAEQVVESKLPLNFQLQLHKLIWGNKRGV
jgi:7-carboxy-7-deazaguanine synthase